MFVFISVFRSLPLVFRHKSQGHCSICCKSSYTVLPFYTLRASIIESAVFHINNSTCKVPVGDTSCVCIFDDAVHFLKCFHWLIAMKGRPLLIIHELSFNELPFVIPNLCSFFSLSSLDPIPCLPLDLILVCITVNTTV